MNTLCTILTHPNNLYEVIFHEGSHDAVDDWLNQVAVINDAYTPDDLVLYLVNTPLDGAMPVVYIMKASQQYAHSHPQRPRTRTATLYRDELQSGIIYVQNLLTSWMQGKREVARFFKRSQRETAIAWLRAEN
jgi:hypothetical protein